MQARVANIDALRGLAIICVLQYHLFWISGAYGWLGVPPLIQDILAYGWAGVDLFFVLSAYLLTNNLQRHADTPRLASAFYKRRALRILPLYWLLLLAGFSLNAVWLAGGGSPDAWLWASHYSLWTYLLFLQNWICGIDAAHVAQFYAPTWSLAVEEHFYLILPLFATRLSRRGLSLLAISWIVLAPLIRLALTTEVNGIAPYVWTVGRLDSFGWGMLLAIAPRLRSNEIFVRSPILTLTVASLLGSCIAVFFPSGPGPAHDGLVGITTMALLSAIAALVSISSDGHRFSRRIAAKALTWCGQRCYSLYLLHMPTVGLSFLLLGQPAPGVYNLASFITTCFACVFILLLADVTYRRVELPFMKLAERIAPYTPAASPLRQPELEAPA
jgi:peptidoglycan/LPS O-acetylase OafA/YrhL